jgi:sortase A
LTVFGVLVIGFIVYLVGASVLEHGRAQASLERSFRQPLAFGQAPLGGAIPEGTPVAVLEIPRLGVREVVVEGTSSAQLKKGPGHLRTSPLPGQRGNAVLAGRRLAYSGPFRHLDRLRRGAMIRVLTGQGRSVYVVTGSRVVSPHHADPIGPTSDSRLTLVTSDPVLLANRRLVITASLRDLPFPAPAGRANQLNRDELGLQGEPGAVVPVLLWGELLLLVGAVAALLYRRWPRWPAYLVCTPVILLLVVLVFDSFAGLLPATL